MNTGHLRISRKAIALGGFAALVILVTVGAFAASNNSELPLHECMIDNIVWHILT